MAQFQAIDSDVAKGLAPPMYGELYEAADGSGRTETITTGNTYQGWKNATAGVLEGLTADTSDATADHLTVPSNGAGDYFISGKVTGFPVTAATVTWKIQLYVGGSPVAHTVTRQRSGGVSEGETQSFTAIVSCSAGDEIALWWTAGSNSDQWNIRSVNLTANRIKTESSAIPITGPPIYGAGPLEGVTADTSDGTADHLTIPAGGAGDYYVEFNTSASISSAGGNIQAAIFVNGTEEPEIHAIEYSSTNTASRSFGASGFLSLSAGDEISVRLANRTNTNDIGVATMQLNIYRVNVDSATAALLGTPLYGCAYNVDEDVSISVQGTYVGTTGWTQHMVRGLTFDASDGTSDHFTIPAGGGGDYLVCFDLQWDHDNTSDVYSAKVHVDGVAVAASDSVSAGTGIPGSSSSTTLALNAGEEVSLRITNASSTNDTFIARGTFTIQRISY
jgi:hypothetical protein